MINYGFGLEKGDLGEKNLFEAMKYFKMSADHGNSFGIFSMDMVLKRIFRLS
jgi:TPR repeat protein